MRRVHSFKTLVSISRDQDCFRAEPSPLKSLLQRGWAVCLAGTLCANAQVTNWVAFNDHAPGSTAGWTTHPNTTTNNMRGVSGGNAGTILTGNLKNIDTGANVPAVLTSSATGTPDDFGGMAYPNAGTDAYNLFNGKVDIGNNQSGIGIRSSSGSATRLTFSNLDPNKRYVLKGTAVRGNNYLGRWTLCTIEGADGFTDDHSAGSVYTAANYPSAGLSAGQAGFHSGENRTTGSVVGWKEINPGSDGTFSVACVQWTANPLPNGSAPDTGNYGYGLCGIMLAEVEIGALVPVAITNQPANATALERGSATFTVGASGSPKYYQWLRGGVGIPGANGPSYTISPVASPGDNGAVFSVIVSNSLNSETSSGATLTVTPDTTPPAAVQALAAPDRTTVTVTFSEPINPGFDVGSFHYFPNGTDPDISAVYADTATLVNGSNIVLSFASAPLTDGVNYSLRIFDVFDTATVPAGGNQIQPYPTILPVRRSLLLVDFNADNVWKYSTATDLFGTGWETAGYDDSDPVLWPSGPAPLGVDTTPNPNVPAINTATTYPASSSLPQFFRRHFFLPSTTNGVVLTMRHVFEDGAVVFLNGQEAGRYNVAAGTLTTATRTIGARGEADPPTGPVPLPLTNVFAGDNVMAVVVLQAGATSTDIYMALELLAEIGEFAAGPPLIQAQPQSQAVFEGANVTFAVSATGALPLFYQWRKDGLPISGATNRTYSINSVVPSQAGNYDVLITNSVSWSNSAIATLAVTPDTTPPTVILALGETNLSQIILTFSEPISAGSAVEPSNYIIELTAGGGNLDVSSAVVVNSTTVLLNLSAPRVQGSNYTITIDASITDLSVAQNSVSPTSYAVSSHLFLIAIDDIHSWRYDQTGTDFGSAWSASAFDDSAWLTGNGLFDVVRGSTRPTVGGETVRTELSLTNAAGTTNSTYYFRTHFSLPSATTNGVVLQLSHLMDDALVVYLNGNEVYRIGITNQPVYYTNYSTDAAVAAAARQGPFLIPLTGLVSGDNVLAAEVHQVNMTSSDVTFGIELLGIIPVVTPIAAPPELTASFEPQTGLLTLTWSGGGTLQRSADLSSPANWENILGATSPFQTNTTATAIQFFRVTVP